MRFRRHWSLAVPLLVALACTPAAPTVPTTGSSAPTGPELAAEQRLTIGYPNLAANLDPHISGGGGGVRRYDIYETPILFKEDRSGVDPLLALSWQTVNPTTWRLTLRTDAKFHDGSALTAADVEYSFKRIQNPDLRSPVRSSLPGITEVKAVDSRTVEIVTQNPDPLLLKRLSQLAVVPKAYIERVGDEAFSKQPLGSGPFRVKEFKDGDRLILTGWTEHSYRKPKLTELTIRLIPDATARLQGLRIGELDVIHQLSMDQGDTLRKESYHVDIRGVAIFGAWLDNQVGGPVTEKKVRQALNYAVDRETLSKTIFRGLAKPIGVPLVEGVFGYNPDLKPYTFDLKKAKDLLAEAGYPTGFKTQIEFWAFNSEVQPSVLYLQSQLKEIGIEIELVPVEVGVYNDKLAKRRPPAPLFFDAGQVVSPLFDADRAIQAYWSEAPSGNRYGNAEFDRLFLASRREMEPKAREDLLRKAVALIHDDPPFLYLVTFNQVSAYPKTVAGIPPLSPDGDWIPFDKVFRVK